MQGLLIANIVLLFMCGAGITVLVALLFSSDWKLRKYGKSQFFEEKTDERKNNKVKK